MTFPLRESFGLAWTLARRDLVRPHAGSLFPVWGIVLPLALAVVSAGFLGPLFGHRFAGPEGNYWIPVLCGILPWLQLQEGLRRGVSCMTDNASWIRSIRFPLWTLPASAVLASLFLTTVLLVLFLPWLWPVSPGGAAAVAAALALQAVFSVGAALLLGALRIYVRDLGPIVVLAMPVWFYLSPVLYPWEAVPERLAWLYAANPLAPLVGIYRGALWGQGASARDLMIFAVWAAALFLAGSAVFRRLEKTLPDEA